jgi:hypothetical protein
MKAIKFFLRKQWKWILAMIIIPIFLINLIPYFNSLDISERQKEIDRFSRMQGMYKEYFNMLTHLEIAQGYTLEEFYIKTSQDDRSVLYARKNDHKPFKSIGDTVEVSILTFSRWGGFMRDKFTISKTFPHKFLKHEFKSIVFYDCGIRI